MNSEKNDQNNPGDSKIKEIFEKVRSGEPKFSLRGSLQEMNNFNFMDPASRLLFSSLCFTMLVVIYAFGEFVIGEELRTALARLFYGGFWTSVSAGLFVGVVAALWELALIKKEAPFFLKFYATDTKKRIYSLEFQKKNFALNFWLTLLIASLPLFALEFDLALFPMLFSLGIPMILFNGEIRKFNEKRISFKNNSSGVSSASISSFAPASGPEDASITSSGISDGFGFWDAFLYFSILLAFLSVIYCFNNLLPRQDTLLERSAVNLDSMQAGNLQPDETHSPDSLSIVSFSAAAITASVILSFMMTLISAIALGLFKGKKLTDGKIKSSLFF